MIIILGPVVQSIVSLTSPFRGPYRAFLVFRTKGLKPVFQSNKRVQVFGVICRLTAYTISDRYQLVFDILLTRTVDKFKGWMILVFTSVVTIIAIRKIMIKECLQRNPVDDMKNYNASRSEGNSLSVLQLYNQTYSYFC